MNKYLLLLFILTGCQKANLQDCPHSFAVENIKAVEYGECDKEELLKDFDDYIAYLDDLKAEGEFRGNIMQVSKPDLSQVERLFCSRGCTATHYTNGQCFVWNSPERINYQRIYRLAQKEPAHCKDYNGLSKKITKNGVQLDYNWRNTEVYKNYNNNSWQKAGEDVLWTKK